MFFYLFVFIFGLIVGSFLNCLIYRLELKELSSSESSSEGAKLPAGSLAPSFIKGRSLCPYCKHILSWQDLIPVLSFLFLRGKCRYCHKKISLQYPLVEIATGLLFLLIFNFLPLKAGFNQFSTCPAPNLFWCGVFNFQNLLYTLYLLLTTCFLLIIFVYDLKHYIIPDKIIYPAILIVLTFRIWDLFGNWKLEIGNLGAIFNYLVAAFGAALFFLLIVFISRGKWLGLGDVKLAFFMGLFLGFPNILIALFLAFFIGAIIGVGLIGAKLKTLKSEVPFGPFLVLGTFIALFWGAAIINWYLNLFHGTI